MQSTVPDKSGDAQMKAQLRPIALQSEMKGEITFCLEVLL